MDRIEDEYSAWSDDFETEKGVVFIDLLLTVTLEFDHPLSKSNVVLLLVNLKTLT